MCLSSNVNSPTSFALVVTILLVLFISYADYSMGSDEMNVGAEKMMLEGGKKGAVPFGHRSHQNRLKDCNICHSFFHQESGSILGLKEKGELKKKQVMKKLCIKCHRAERPAGNEHGPTTCSKCHVR